MIDSPQALITEPVARSSVQAQRALLLANLFRDQLDRYGELEIIADRWAGIVAGLVDRVLGAAEVDLIATVAESAAPTHPVSLLRRAYGI